MCFLPSRNIVSLNSSVCYTNFNFSYFVYLFFFLSNNRITLEGAAHLNKGLMQNDALRVLKVGQNPMQSQGAYLLLSALKNNPNIALVEIELTVSSRSFIFISCILFSDLVTLGNICAVLWRVVSNEESGQYC